MATGEAAGVMAALACKKDCALANVDPAELQNALAMRRLLPEVDQKQG